MAVVASLPEHPHIVSHYRAWQQAAHFYIQMELCNGGSLANKLHRVRGLPLIWLSQTMYHWH